MHRLFLQMPLVCKLQLQGIIDCCKTHTQLHCLVMVRVANACTSCISRPHLLSALYPSGWSPTPDNVNIDDCELDEDLFKEFLSGSSNDVRHQLPDTSSDAVGNANAASGHLNARPQGKLSHASQAELHAAVLVLW